MIVKFSCYSCNTYRQPVAVTDRTPEQSVTDWMEKIVIPTVVSIHGWRSPDCQLDTISELLIPTPAGTTDIGVPVKQ